MNIVIIVVMGIGLFFNLMSVLGLLRFPDVYTRLHAGTKCTTFGAMFIVAAVVIYSIWTYEGGSSLTIIIHSLIAFLVIIFTNPIGAHAIARGAHKSGVKPYGAVADELKETKEKPFSSKLNNNVEKAEAEK